jgi:radical SAM-linked protein
MKLRMQFTKEEPVRYISHLDLARAFERAIRRAKLPVAMSEGFNPHMKVAYASALSVGVTSSCEYIDIEMREAIAGESAITALRQQMPAGLNLVRYQVMEVHPAALMKVVNMADYAMEVPLSKPIDRNWLQDQLALFAGLPEIMFTRTSPKGSRTLDIRPLMQELRIVECSQDRVKFSLRTHITDKGSIKPQEVLRVFAQLYDIPLREDAAVIHRTGLWVWRNNKSLSPLDVIK